MRNLSPALVAKRGLSAFVYQLVAADRAAVAVSPAGAATAAFDTHARTLEAMTSWGLPVERHWRRCANIAEVIAFCAEWADKRSALEFETDGVVVKVDDLALRD